jgi:hypothetical protein
LPILLPVAIDAVEPQSQHGLGLLKAPPRPRTFETLLNDVAMGTLDLAEPDRKSLLLSALRVEVLAAVGEIALGGAHRGVGLLDTLRRQIGQDGVESMGLEAMPLKVTKSDLAHALDCLRLT